MKVKINFKNIEENKMSLRKVTLAIAVAAIPLTSQADLIQDARNLGITACDTIINKINKDHVNTGPNMTDVFHIPNSGLKTMDIKVFYGGLKDTVHQDYSLRQKGNNCYVTHRATITSSNSCKNTVDKRYWTVTEDNPSLDYTNWENKGGVNLYTKAFNGGCIQEYITHDIY